MSKWFERHKRAYLLDFQMPDSADRMPIGQARNLRAVDPADIVRRLHQAGVQVYGDNRFVVPRVDIHAIVELR